MDKTTRSPLETYRYLMTTVGHSSYYFSSRILRQLEPIVRALALLSSHQAKDIQIWSRHDTWCQHWLCWFVFIRSSVYLNGLLFNLRILFLRNGTNDYKIEYVIDGINRIYWLTKETIHIYEPRHEIYNNAVCATSKALDQPVHKRSLIRAFASRLNILW